MGRHDTKRTVASAPFVSVSLVVSHKDVFSCDQAALRTLISVRPSVRLSVCLSVTSFWLCSCHRIIMKFSGVVTVDKSEVHAKGQGQRSTVKVTEFKTQLSRFRTITPVWIHVWQWNCAQSLMSHYCFSRSSVKFQGHTAKKSSIWTQIGSFRNVTAAWIQQWLWNDTQSLKQYRTGALLFFKVIRQICRSHGTQKGRFWPELSVSGL